MLSLFHCVPLTYPARKAALSGYHIILIPAPVTGGAPGDPGNEAAPVKTTLLSFTCNIAAGVAVLIPTFPTCACSIITIDCAIAISKTYLIVLCIMVCV